MNNKQTDLHITALLLVKGKIIDKFSTIFTFIFLIITLLITQLNNYLLLIICLAGFLIGLIEKYYAIRTSLDAELFSFLKKAPQQLSENLHQLDETLINLKLLKKSTRTRPLIERQQGALLLLKKQLACAITQIIAILLVIIMGLTL